MSIKVENLTKYYGEQLAVDNISFEIKTGEIVGFLGPNGAGKSTTLKIITTYLAPTEGKIYVDGIDADFDPISVRRKIGYLPEQNPLYNDMNVIDYLVYTAKLQSVPKNEINNAVNKMIKVCGLEEVKHKDIDELSKGFKQRVGLAQAMIHDPEVLLLDEPTSGLDPNQIVEIRKLIQDLGKQKTLMLSTHILQEVRAVCDRVIIIDKGAIRADASPDSLQKDAQSQLILKLTIKVNKKFNQETIKNEFEKIKNVEFVKCNLNKDNNLWLLDIQSSKGLDVREDVFKKVVSSGLELVELKQEETSLEDAFRKLTN
ncbi:MAG: ATP-binding cassette domain-containing protein [Ignavibacteria bacterium]|nr:ATP-binding cassette domain-containing protein [Ignavibacteria bacterium]